MKKPVSLFIVGVLFLFCAAAASAAEFSVAYKRQYQQKPNNNWVWVNTVAEVKTVSGMLINSEEAAKNEIRKEFGAKKGEDTYVQTNGTLYRILWERVTKVEAQKKEKASSNEPKQGWVDRNFKPLK